MQVAAALQTWPVPQLSPGLLVVPFVHAADGLQTVTPFVQGSLLVAQAAPAMHALQAPLKQSLLLPHGVPSRAATPSWQLGPSAPQTIRPTLHGAPGFVSHACAVEHPAVSCAPASKLPELTAASTMSPTWLGVRLSVQPGVRQQTPMFTEAELTRSQL
jgi:hypothetical protein